MDIKERIQDLTLDQKAKLYFMGLLRKGVIDTLPEDPKAAYIRDMMDKENPRMDPAIRSDFDDPTLENLKEAATELGYLNENMPKGVSDYDMLRSFQKDELLDDLGDIVAKYVKDPDDIDRELDRFDIGGIDAMSNLVTANLLRDPEYQAWAKKFNRIKESNDVRKVIKKMIKEQSFDDRLKSMMGTGDFEKATTPQMPEATKVWDALVKTFSDNKNDSISYLNSDKTYRSIAIREIFRAMNF